MVQFNQEKLSRKTLKCIVLLTSSVTPILAIILSAVAQSPSKPRITIPSTTPETIEPTIPIYPDSQPPLPLEAPASPPEQNLETPPTPQLPGCTPSTSSERFLIEEIEVLGNTVLQAEIAALTKQLENQEVTFEDLLCLRSQITQLYLDNGYVTSGAFIPNNQVLGDQVVTIQVVEGELEEIQISGLDRLREDYVRERLALATDPPLNRNQLEEALQLLQLNPLFERVNAELTVGTTPGENILLVDLKEAPAFHTGLVADNYRSPSLGSEQASTFITHENLLGFGDRLSAEYGITEGLDIYDISYAIPISASDGTLDFRISNSDSRIIEDEFQDLDIRSETETYSLTLRQPIVKTPNNEFAFSFGFDLRRSQTFILENRPFSFTEGPEDGESKVTVLRFSQDWVNRNGRRVLAARSQFSFGIDAFDATTNNGTPDGEFFTWLGQFQWVQQLSPRILTVTRLDAQLTPDALLPLEQFSMGGVNTLRGYRENQRVTDNGVIGSVEVRLPLTSDPNILQLAPFFELGTAWNNKEPDPDPATLASLGLGLYWSITPALNVRLDYGVPLIAVDDQGDSLQENGFYFSLRYQPF